MEPQQSPIWLKYIESSSGTTTTTHTTLSSKVEGTDVVTVTLKEENNDSVSGNEPALHYALSLSENECDIQTNDSDIHLAVPLVEYSEVKPLQQSILKRPTKSLLTHNKSKGFRKIVVYPRRQQNEEEQVLNECGENLPENYSQSNSLTVYRTETDPCSAMAIIPSGNESDANHTQSDHIQQDSGFSISVSGIEPGGDAVLSAFVGDDFSPDEDFLTVVNPVSGSVTMMPFKDLFEDKNNTLMTPQELESMPENGIEFEESVGPKEYQAEDENIHASIDGSSCKVRTTVELMPNTSRNRKGTSCKSQNFTLGKVLIKTDNTANVTQIVIDHDQLEKIQQLMNNANNSTDTSSKVMIAPKLPNRVQTPSLQVSDNQELSTANDDAATLISELGKHSDSTSVTECQILPVGETTDHSAVTCSRGSSQFIY